MGGYCGGGVLGVVYVGDVMYKWFLFGAALFLWV